MYKIELTEKIKKKHCAYFKENIVNILDNVKFKFVNNHTDNFKIHEEFIRYVKKNYTRFAVSDFDELKELYGDIEKMGIANILDKKVEIIRNKSGEDNKKGQKKSTKKYASYLNEVFGYEKFKMRSVFDVFLRKAKEKVNGECYCELVPELKNILARYFPINEKEISSIDDNCEIEDLKKIFEKSINIDFLNYKSKMFSNEWNDYVFIFETGLKVCPYCNRQYINPILSDNGRNRADIDHFLPKSKYPYFSMSLYNMIPVCKSCNRSLKNSAEFDFDNVNPYAESINDTFNFHYAMIRKRLKVDIINDRIKEHVEKFKLGTQYNAHINVAEELYIKKQMYPDSYIEELLKKNELFRDKNELKEFVFGYFSDKDKLNDEILAKLRRDLAIQMDIINSKNYRLDKNEREKLERIFFDTKITADNS